MAAKGPPAPISLPASSGPSLHPSGTTRGNGEWLKVFGFVLCQRMEQTVLFPARRTHGSPASPQPTQVRAAACCPARQRALVGISSSIRKHLFKPVFQISELLIADIEDGTDQVGGAAPRRAAGIPLRGSAAPGADGYLRMTPALGWGVAQSFRKYEGVEKQNRFIDFSRERPRTRRRLPVLAAWQSRRGKGERATRPHSFPCHRGEGKGL